MQTFEIGVIVSQDCSQISKGIGENLRVVDALVGSTGLLNGSDIFAETAQLFDDWTWEVFIGIESGHWTSLPRFRGCPHRSRPDARDNNPRPPRCL